MAGIAVYNVNPSQGAFSSVLQKILPIHQRYTVISNIFAILDRLKNKFEKLTPVFFLPLTISGQTHFHSIELDHLTLKAIDYCTYISKASQNVLNGTYYLFFYLYYGDYLFFRSEHGGCLVIHVLVPISPQILSLVKLCPFLLKNVSLYFLGH